MRTMVSRGAAVALALAVALPATVLAANIDTDGFTMDGVTTYCQGVTDGAGGAMSFPNLLPNSVNRCPILVKLKSDTTVHQRAVLTVEWKAAAKFGDIPGNIFPNAIDKGTKTPQHVQASLIKACKAGTNCGVVIDGTPIGGNQDTGPFDGSGSKALKSYEFNFADQGEFILVGKVLLPGDPSLNVSGTEFIAFQKINVVDPSTKIEPTPTPTPSASDATTPTPSEKSTAGSNDGAVEEDVGTVGPSKETPLASTDDIPNEDSASVAAGAQEEKGFFASHGVLLAIIGGACIVVFTLGYVVVMRRKRRTVTATKLDRSHNRTFMSHSDNQLMDDPEPMPYIRTKTVRSNDHSVPIMSRPSTDSVDHIMDLSKRGSEMDPSFDDETPSFDEGTVTASNKAVSAIERRTQDQRASSEVTTASTKMMLASLYQDDRDTALYQGKTAQESVRESTEQRAFYQSEQWNPAETARPYEDSAREQSTISFMEEEERDSNSRRGGFGAISFTSEGGFDNEERHTRFNSEASVDSYAFRPSNVSVADSYKSRVSRYSMDDMDRDSSRISGMSLYSERDTDV